MKNFSVAKIYYLHNKLKKIIYAFLCIKKVNIMIYKYAFLTENP